MRAIRLHTNTGLDGLRLDHIPRPALDSPTALLVRLKAAGCNPIDVKQTQRGTFYPQLMPAILGCDGAGVVEMVGPDVTDFRPGDPVFFCNGGLGGPHGCYADYTVVDQAHAVRKPEALDFAQAAALPLALITAWEALHDLARLERDQFLLVQAGAGGTGHFAVQLGRLAQARVCTTVSTPEKARLAQQLGADECFNYRDGPYLESLHAFTQGAGADVCLDNLGGSVFNTSILSTRYQGTLVTLLQPPADADWAEARWRNLRICQELMLTPQIRGSVPARVRQTLILREAASLVDRGLLRVIVQRSWPLTETASALHTLAQGSATGKLVLEMH
jgi:NADPH2:quinone reductase